MKIYSMTATFGKLEHETLELKPGLNVITAPNEWGKSTWCAFLTAMLYGLDTRAKSTKTALADKERYAPWSGAPMAGRMDIRWKGRDITIERSTKRRVPLGEFRAYETDTGVPVEELTAANCGEMLLGVEQSVFKRAGFIRFSELPVTQDEALRRRLNALVTTGDESGSADALADSLRDLKNRCRYNRSGLLPQAEQEKAEIQRKITELEELEDQSEKLRTRLQQVKQRQEALHNHQLSLSYAQARTAAEQLSQAERSREEARLELAALESACGNLPSKESAQDSLAALHRLRENWNEVRMDVLPQMPEEPRISGPFAGLSVEEAQHMVQKDGRLYGSLTTSKLPFLLLLMGGLGLLPSVTLLILQVYLFGAVAAAVSLLAMGWGLWEGRSRKKQMAALREKYGTADVTHWVDAVHAYEEAHRRYDAGCAVLRQKKADQEARLDALKEQMEVLCNGREPDEAADYWQKVMSTWDDCAMARRECRRAEEHYETIRAMVRPAEKPAGEDLLDYSQAETARLLADCAAEQQQLQNRLGQHQGAMAALGEKRKLTGDLEKGNRRIAALERTYAALALAQETLAEARTELQRRFAPRITKRAQELMSALTDGRYHSLSMGEDLSLRAGAGREDVLHEALWRSDGTVDQLYLSLRLAVAEELTPGAPLVLDDALIRFDDERMAAAVGILKDLSEHRQILLFTCQGREKAML